MVSKLCKCGEKHYAKGLCIKCYGREYRQQPEVKVRIKEYHQKLEVKIQKREYRQQLENKLRKKELRQTLKYKVKQKKYSQRPEVKFRIKKWSQQPEVKERRKEYLERPEVKERLKEYYECLEVKARENKRHMFKYYNDALYNLKIKIRGRLRSFLKLKHIPKNKSSKQIVGCTPQQLRDHIENQFISDMSWESVLSGEIHIDHNIPLDTAKTEEDVYRLGNYINLQPMWAKDNLSKGAMMPEEWKEYKILKGEK